MATIPTYEWVNFRRVTYKGTGVCFIPVCTKCGRFVTADNSIKFNVEYGFNKKEANATCKKCGRVGMIFEGYY